MNVLRRIFGISDDHSGAGNGHIQRAMDTDDEIMHARQDFRQAVQRVQSGARVLDKKTRLIETWDSGLEMLSRKNHE